MAPVEEPLARRPPEVPDDLRAAALEGVDLRRGRFEEVAIDGRDLSGAAAADLHLERVALTGTDLSAARVRGLRIRDGIVTEGTGANIDAIESTLLRVEFRGLRATGASFAEAHLSDVLFDGCRIDLAQFRFATLDRVVFRDCRLEEANFYGATLFSVVFERSSLAAATFEAASFDRCEIRGGDLTDLHGVRRLAGVRMAWPEVIQIAGLAEAGGITVIE